MSRAKFVRPTEQTFNEMDAVERRRVVRDLIRAVGHEVSASNEAIEDAMGIGDGYLEVCFEGPVGDLGLAESRIRSDFARQGFTN